MSLYTFVYIGPIQSIAYNLEPSWGSAPANAQGTREMSLKATLTLQAAEQLSELVANGALRKTVGAYTGAQVYIFFNGGVSREFNGWYLLQSSSFDPYRLGTPRYANVSLSAVHLGAHRQAVVTRSARNRANSYSLTPAPMVADPFVGGGFVRPPGGTKVTREFDPNPHDPARVATVPAVMGVYLNPTAQVIPCTPEGR